MHLLGKIEVLEQRQVLVHGPGTAEVGNSAGGIAVSHVRRQDNSRGIDLSDTEGHRLVRSPRRIDQWDRAAGHSGSEATAGVAASAEKVLSATDYQRSAAHIGVDCRYLPVAHHGIEYRMHM